MVYVDRTVTNFGPTVCGASHSGAENEATVAPVLLSATSSAAAAEAADVPWPMTHCWAAASAEFRCSTA